MLSSIAYDSDTGSGSNPVYYTYYSYNGLGTLSSVAINDGRPRTVTYSSDVAGQGMRRDEADASTATGDPHEIWYRFAGKEMGYSGNNDDTGEMRYAQSITDRQAATPTTPGPFRAGSATSIANADFVQGLDRINSYGQASTAGSYTVNGTSANPKTGSGRAARVKAPYFACAAAKPHCPCSIPICLVMRVAFSA